MAEKTSLDTFGERLTAERRKHGLEISAVAGILGVDPRVLRALEENDFDALPSDPELRKCFAGYAGCLDVDADLMLEDFLAEREKSRQAVPRRPPARAASATPMAPAAASRGTRRRFAIGSLPVLALAVGALALAALGAWRLASRPSERPPIEASFPSAEKTRTFQPTEPIDAPKPAFPDETEPMAAAPAAETASPTSAREPDPAQRIAAEPTTAERRSPETARGAVEPATGERPEPTAPIDTSVSQPTTERPALTIADHGVGTAVENRRLVGRGSRFTPGSRVVFWTSVRGGAPGRRIDHVWLRGGAEVDRVPLLVEAATWRTYSAKTLVGTPASWAVEARDEAGRVLARTDFVSR